MVPFVLLIVLVLVLGFYVCWFEEEDENDGEED